MEDGATYLGKYELRGILGRGGMGVVYQGYDPHIERVVAIKTVRLGMFDGDQEQEILARFKREAQAVGRLSHPNVVQVYEYGEHNGKPYIAMEFVQGRELGQLLEEGVRFELAQSLRMAEQMLSALAYCHAQGVVHRDLKPANLLVLDNGTIKLTDFGIARLESSTLTRTGAVMGTPNYMSPEQLTGQSVDARSDLFAAGVILYELLTDEKPFPGKTMPVIMNRVLRAEFERPSTLNVHLSASWDRLFARALAKRPDDRFQSAEAFLQALQLAVEDRYVDGAAADDELQTMVAQGDADATVIHPRAAQAAASAKPAVAGSGTAAAGQAAPPPPASAATGEGPSGAAPAAAGRLGAGARAAGLAAVALIGGLGAWQAGLLDAWLGRVAQPPQASSVRPPGLGESWAPARSEPPAAAPADTAASLAPPATAPGDQGAAAAAAAPAAAAPAPAGGVDIKTAPRDGAYYGLVVAATDPPGATLLIDEVVFGETPLELEVPPGVYQVRLRKDGFRDLQTQINVDPATQVRLSGQLQAR